MWGYLGLVTAYILIASVLLWLFISSRTYLGIKILIVPVILWYGLVLYYTPGNLSGWPIEVSSIDKLPDDAIITSIIIREPSKLTSDPGGIFMTIIKPSSKTKIAFTLNPKDAFTYTGSDLPRLYKVPYSRELHKQILEAQKMQKGRPGSSIKTKIKIKVKDGNKKGTIGEENSNDKQMFRIVNPIELIPKE
jgi:hypothetical protein